MWIIFKSFCSICNNISSVLYFGFLAIKHLSSPTKEIEPIPPALESKVSATGACRGNLWIHPWEQFCNWIRCISKSLLEPDFKRIHILNLQWECAGRCPRGWCGEARLSLSPHSLSLYQYFLSNNPVLCPFLLTTFQFPSKGWLAAFPSCCLAVGKEITILQRALPRETGLHQRSRVRMQGNSEKPQPAGAQQEGLLPMRFSCFLSGSCRKENHSGSLWWCSHTALHTAGEMLRASEEVWP